MPAIGFAVDPLPTDTAPNLEILPTIQKVLNLIFWVVLIVSIFYIMFAGFKIVTAGGDPKGMEGAVTAVRNAVIGIIIAVLAKGLSSFASTILR